MRVALLTLVLLLMMVAVAGAADDTAGDSEENVVDSARRASLQPTSLGFWAGVSRDSPTGVLLGETPGRDFHEFAVRLNWQMLDVSWFRMDYMVDLIPLAMVTGNPVTTISSSGFRPTQVAVFETRYGIGASPFGLRLGVQASDRVFLFASGSAGFLIFEDNVPTLRASFFNFTFDFGGGVEALVTERWGIMAGYKLHHLSNGDRAIENPGIDSNMAYLGLGWVY